jgi:hypothetical protein
VYYFPPLLDEELLEEDPELDLGLDLELDELGLLYPELDLELDELGLLYPELDLELDELGLLYPELDLELDELGLLYPELLLGVEGLFPLGLTGAPLVIFPFPGDVGYVFPVPIFVLPD